jgi:hypothetical protein
MWSTTTTLWVEDCHIRHEKAETVAEAMKIWERGDVQIVVVPTFELAREVLEATGMPPDQVDFHIASGMNRKASGIPD